MFPRTHLAISTRTSLTVVAALSILAGVVACQSRTARDPAPAAPSASAVATSSSTDLGGRSPSATTDSRTTDAATVDLTSLGSAARAPWGQSMHVRNADGSGTITPLSATWRTTPIDQYDVGPVRKYYLIMKIRAKADTGLLQPYGDLNLLSAQLPSADGQVGPYTSSSAAGDSMARADSGANDLLDVSPSEGQVYGYIVFDVPVDSLSGYLVYEPNVVAWDLSGMTAASVATTATAADLPPWVWCSAGHPQYAAKGGDASVTICQTGSDYTLEYSDKAGMKTWPLVVTSRPSVIAAGAGNCGAATDGTTITFDCDTDHSKTAITQHWSSAAWLALPAS